MKKLFIRFLALYIALLPLIPSIAEAANRFAVCTTTCTWDNTSTAMWSTTSGGATGASAPVAADDVIINAATCVGGTTCTITTFAGTISAQSVTWGACTATTTGCIIDASANNTNFTLLTNVSSGTSFSASANGSRKWLGGTGTYALTSNNANSCIDVTGTGDLGSTFGSATWSCSGTTTSQRAWNGGAFSYGATTLNANSSGGSIQVLQSNTFASLTINAPNFVVFQGGATQTITGALNFNGGSSSVIGGIVSNNNDSPATLSLGAASAASWITMRAITTSGAAALSATNCFNTGRVTLANSGICTIPSGGGGTRGILGSGI